MNGFILMLPLFVIRFLLLGWLNPTALKRGAHFPPLVGRERIAYYVYQLANGFLLIYPLFLKVHGPFWLLVAGGVVYGLGVLLLLPQSVLPNPIAKDSIRRGVTVFPAIHCM